MTDRAAQRADTFATFADIQAEVGDLPDMARIDYAFLPGPDADWNGAMQALADQGYDCARVDPDPDEPDALPWLEASLPDQPVSAGAIWMGEDLATTLARPFGFEPDGWGFMS